MANLDHLNVLTKGIEFWNNWRKENPEIKPDLSEVDLEGFDLRWIDFSAVNLFKANLVCVDFTGAKLWHADLRGADLWKAKFYNANLTKADLSWAYLSDTKFAGANLSVVNFKRSILTNSHLSGENNVKLDTKVKNENQENISEHNKHKENGQETIDLTEPNINDVYWGMSKLYDAKLPSSINEFQDTLNAIRETSQNSSSIFLTMLGVCAYLLITVGTTTDEQLLLNNLYLKLPVINSEVPVSLFFISAPLIIYLVFCK